MASSAADAANVSDVAGLRSRADDRTKGVQGGEGAAHGRTVTFGALDSHHERGTVPNLGVRGLAARGLWVVLEVVYDSRVVNVVIVIVPRARAVCRGSGRTHFYGPLFPELAQHGIREQFTEAGY